jgi:hypothetical protein
LRAWLRLSPDGSVLEGLMKCSAEDNFMHRAKHCVLALFVTTALLAPVAIMAAPAAARQEDRDRIYDKEHKDYHHWDDKEDAAWKRFLAEKHRKDHEFAKANEKEQSEYWQWRHSHPD